MITTAEDLARQGGVKTSSDEHPDDILLVSASFEPRATFVVENLSDDYRVREAYVYVNAEFLEGNSANRTRTHLYKIIEKVARHAESVKVIEGSWLSPARQIQSIRGALVTEDKATIQTATIDCSTFNRETLLTTVMLLRSNFPNLELRVLYSSPVEHGEWLSRGYRSLRNVMGLSGVHFPSKPTVLVILSGFEPHRTQKIIEEHEPTKVLLGIGDPPTSVEFLERNRSEQKLVLSRQEVEEFTFPVSDIQSCADKLVDVVSGYTQSHNIVLAPMSTKLSTLASLLVVEKYPDIQVTYCLPGEYNVEDYSKGVRALYSQTLLPRNNQVQIS